MWFSYLTTPLGPNVRFGRKFIVDLSTEYGLVPPKKVCFNVKEVVASDVGKVIELVRADPDVADLVRLGIRRFLLGYIS